MTTAEQPKNENLKEVELNPVEDVKPRGKYELLDERSGAMHFFETEEERIKFLEELHDKDNQ